MAAEPDLLPGAVEEHEAKPRQRDGERDAGEPRTAPEVEDPEGLGRDLLAGVRAHLGDGFDIATHFTPRYRPWRQRLAVVPDGDLFKCIRAGKVSVVTDRVERFTEEGVRLESGKELKADIVVTATGFELCPLGDIAFAVDGAPLNFAECWGYRGILFTGVPNMAWVFGYLRASWTMRADMVSAFVCRLLNHMAARKARTVTARLREEDADMRPRPFIEPENFNAGYLTRSMHLMPRQGDRDPWFSARTTRSRRRRSPRPTWTTARWSMGDADPVACRLARAGPALPDRPCRESVCGRNAAFPRAAAPLFSSFPRRRESRTFLQNSVCEVFGMDLLDSRLRGNDENRGAGFLHKLLRGNGGRSAGMTGQDGAR